MGFLIDNESAIEIFKKYLYEYCSSPGERQAFEVYYKDRLEAGAFDDADCSIKNVVKKDTSNDSNIGTVCYSDFSEETWIQLLEMADSGEICLNNTDFIVAAKSPITILYYID